MIGLIFLQKAAQVCAAKTIRVRMKSRRETLVVVVRVVLVILVMVVRVKLVILVMLPS